MIYYRIAFATSLNIALQTLINSALYKDTQSPVLVPVKRAFES